MSKDIKDNENLTEDTVEEIKETKDEDVLAELAMDKEATLLAKQEKKEAKKAAKLAKKEAKKKKKDSEDKEYVQEDVQKEIQTETISMAEQVSNEEKSEEKSNVSKVEDSKKQEESEGSAEEPKQKKKKKKEKEEKNPEDINIVSELLNLIIYIGIVVLICYFVITFVGCRSRVDGDSMNPTLEDGDNLWVDKLSYTFGDPDRFDVIIFNYNEDTTYVKRIIGLPGETVRIDINGNIYINNKLLVESYGNEVIKPTNIGRASVDVVLGDGEYFVLGDNRNNSSDSRWPDVGNVHEDDILGKVILRIYPFTSIGTIK